MYVLCSIYFSLFVLLTNVCLSCSFLYFLQYIVVVKQTNRQEKHTSLKLDLASFTEGGAVPKTNTKTWTGCAVLQLTVTWNFRVLRSRQHSLISFLIFFLGGGLDSERKFPQNSRILRLKSGF